MDDSARARRIRRLQAGGAVGTLLSVRDFAGARAARLSIVGDVVGITTAYVGIDPNGGSCGWSPVSAWADGRDARRGSPVVSTLSADGRRSPWAGWRSLTESLVERRRATWLEALDRLRQEAQQLGADGVVGVTLRERPLGGDTDEVVATGTAVLAPDLRRPDAGRTRPWLAGLSLAECVVALRAGHRPAGMVVVLAFASKHRDRATRRQRWSRRNAEVEGASRLLSAARRDARELATRDAALLGTGTLLLQHMASRHLHTTCRNGIHGVDDHAVVSLLGTLVTPLPRTAAQPPALVLPLVDAPAGAPPAPERRPEHRHGVGHRRGVGHRLGHGAAHVAGHAVEAGLEALLELPGL